jgi:hypothetical protein
MARAIGAMSADADGLLGFLLTRVRPQEDKISVTAISIAIILQWVSLKELTHNVAGVI